MKHSSVDYPELLADPDEGLHSPIDVLDGVGRADLCPDPGLAPGHHGEAEAHHQDALLLQHHLGEGLVDLLIPEHHWADGMLLPGNREPGLGHRASESIRESCVSRYFC